MSSYSFRQVIRIMTAILMLCFIFALFPITASASSVKKPGRVKSLSVITEQNDSENTAKVTVKWKKVKKNCTAYQVYQKTGKGKWKRIKTVKQNSSSITVTVKTGKKYRFKVRAVNKRKKKRNYKTAKGKFSQSVTVSIEKNGGLPDNGGYEVGFTDVRAESDSRILSCIFEYTNWYRSKKNPADCFIIKVTQDGEELSQRSGSISCTVKSSKTVKRPLTFELISDNPVLIQIIDKKDKKTIIDELEITVD